MVYWSVALDTSLKLGHFLLRKTYLFFQQTTLWSFCAFLQHNTCQVMALVCKDSVGYWMLTCFCLIYILASFLCLWYLDCKTAGCHTFAPESVWQSRLVQRNVKVKKLSASASQKNRYSSSPTQSTSSLNFCWVWETFSLLHFCDIFQQVIFGATSQRQPWLVGEFSQPKLRHLFSEVWPADFRPWWLRRPVRGEAMWSRMGFFHMFPLFF